MPARSEHAANFAQGCTGVVQVLEHPKAHDEIKRLIDEGQALAHAADHRHARGAMVGQGRRIRIEACGQLDLAPEQLDHATTAASEVKHPAARRDVAADDGFELVSARPPAGPDRAIALAIRVLERERQQPPASDLFPCLSHAGGILTSGVPGRNPEVGNKRRHCRLTRLVVRGPQDRGRVDRRHDRDAKR